MTTLTATTPFGTFTRDTHTAYTHVAIFSGDIRLVGSAGIAARRKGLPTTVEFGAVWSRSERNARKAKIGYSPNAKLEGVFPVDALAPAVAAMFVVPEPTPEPEPEPVVEQTHVESVLTREEALWMINTSYTARQVGKSYTHQLKHDRKDETLARTYCGVPVKGASQNWLRTSDSLSCPTCVATKAKLARKSAKILAKAA
jgi:hypothetical protein